MPGATITLKLRGIIYGGQGHFTCRYIEKSGEIWFHDVRVPVANVPGASKRTVSAPTLQTEAQPVTKCSKPAEIGGLKNNWKKAVKFDDRSRTSTSANACYPVCARSDQVHERQVGERSKVRSSMRRGVLAVV
ncbi:hypothetical protein B0H19DRAFT_1072279 [Mycena capillaripes]|nr:hypothetical protein B0H19DRAFT_1072279 [Mycena capillaripes]